MIDAEGGAAALARSLATQIDNQETSMRTLSVLLSAALLTFALSTRAADEEKPDAAPAAEEPAPADAKAAAEPTPEPAATDSEKKEEAK